MKDLFLFFCLFLLLLPGPGYSQETDSSKMDTRKRLEAETRRNNRLPPTDFYYNMVKDYVPDRPDSEYFHASDKAYEAFHDIKYGVRIHWGVYAIPEYTRVSWDFLYSSDEDRQHYQELYKTFNPVHFDAEEWMSLFRKAGFRSIAFTAKHHDGFSMFDTRTRVRRRVNYLAPGGPAIEECDLPYSIMQTPYKKDIVKEICDAAHRNGLAINLYFSHPDWYDADFRPYAYHPLQTKASSKNHEKRFLEYYPKTIVPEPDSAAVHRMILRHRTQIRELLTNYGKIDMICFDQWLGAEVWPQMRETLKMVRELQPDVMLRERGIGNYGDYFTPEAFVPAGKEKTDMAWMVIYPLGINFGYDSSAKDYKGAPWIIRNLVDAVSKGGNFMVGIGPDGSGRFHPTAVAQILEAGQWLAVNGEGIYGTRSREVYQEGNVRYTISRDSATLYAFALEWPGQELVLHTVRPSKETGIHLLGYAEPLSWKYKKGLLRIHIPEELQDESRRPCESAWGFRIDHEKP